MKNSFKTDAEKSGATIRLATAVKVVNNVGKHPATTGRLADMLEIFHTALSPSSESFWRKCLEKLISESMVAKSQTVNDIGKTVDIYRLLKPLETIEAFFASYKWDKRQRKTREKQNQPKVTIIKPVKTSDSSEGKISERVSYSKGPKSVHIKAGSVEITINL